MPYDSNGNYSLPPGYLVANGDTILPAQHNPPFEDVAAALSAVLLRSGVAPMTGNLKMGSKKITGLAVGTVATDAVNKSQLDGIFSTENTWTQPQTRQGSGTTGFTAYRDNSAVNSFFEAKTTAGSVFIGNGSGSSFVVNDSPSSSGAWINADKTTGIVGFFGNTVWTSGNQLALGTTSSSARTAIGLTSSLVGSLTADLSVGAVGTYGLFRCIGGGGVSQGDTVAGSNLAYDDAGGGGTTQGSPLGTWVNVSGSVAANSGTGSSVGVFKRVA